MISWLVLVILVGIALVALKMNKIRHKVWIVTIVLLAIFLYASLSLVYGANEIELKSVDGFSNAAKVYLGWLANGFQNFKSVTGNAVKMDWTSTNGTFFNKTKIEAEKL